jgi:hypothetical protein
VHNRDARAQDEGDDHDADRERDETDDEQCSPVHGHDSAPQAAAVAAGRGPVSTRRW